MVMKHEEWEAVSKGAPTSAECTDGEHKKCDMPDLCACSCHGHGGRKFVKETTTVRVSGLTLLWIKRLQGLLQYRGQKFTMDDVILVSVREFEYHLSKDEGLTEKSRDQHFEEVAKELSRKIHDGGH